MQIEAVSSKANGTVPFLLEIDHLPQYTPDWAREAIHDFTHELAKKGSDFPCTFGIQNYKEKSLRFVFVESREPEELDRLAAALREYTRNARSFGVSSSSLVCVFKPEASVATVRGYELWFWEVLQALNERDTEAWPAEFPTDPEDTAWAYCFAGEGHFVVCNTPEHDLRRSRKSLVPMITFTPRWSFKGIEGNTRPGIAVRELIRQRVDQYDRVPASKSMSAYGQGLDWVQYYLDDNNDPPALSKCPFHVATAKKEA